MRGRAERSGLRETVQKGGWNYGAYHQGGCSGDIDGGSRTFV